MTAECSAFRCMYSTIYLTPFQCRALPGPVPHRESRETALAVSIQKGLSVSLLFIIRLYGVVLLTSSLQIQAFHSKVMLLHICLLFHDGSFHSSVFLKLIKAAQAQLLLPEAKLFAKSAYTYPLRSIHDKSFFHYLSKPVANLI